MLRVSKAGSEHTKVEVAISDIEFIKLRDFFYRKTGIAFDISKRYFVDKRVIERMTQCGYEKFSQYFTFMRFQASGEEIQHLINTLTVNETYFFREQYQFECLTGGVLKDLTSHCARGKTLRIWSIPSSTGEEPYSIAIYLLEKWPDIENFDIEIISSDIDSNVLQKCERGIYNQRSVQNLPTAILQQYFTQLGNGDYQICQDLRDSITFTQVNLNDTAQTRCYRNIDVIFCRNLLIYFDDAARRRAAEVFYDALEPGGYLFLGHSESMSRISSLFKVKKVDNTLVYQKPRR